MPMGFSMTKCAEPHYFVREIIPKIMMPFWFAFFVAMLASGWSDYFSNVYSILKSPSCQTLLCFIRKMSFNQIVCFVSLILFFASSLLFLCPFNVSSSALSLIQTASFFSFFCFCSLSVVFSEFFKIFNTVLSTMLKMFSMVFIHINSPFLYSIGLVKKVNYTHV